MSSAKSFFKSLGHSIQKEIGAPVIKAAAGDIAESFKGPIEGVRLSFLPEHPGTLHESIYELPPVVLVIGIPIFLASQYQQNF